MIKHTDFSTTNKKDSRNQEIKHSSSRTHQDQDHQIQEQAQKPLDSSKVNIKFKNKIHIKFKIIKSIYRDQDHRIQDQAPKLLNSSTSQDIYQVFKIQEQAKEPLNSYLKRWIRWFIEIVEFTLWIKYYDCNNIFRSLNNIFSTRILSSYTF